MFKGWLGYKGFLLPTGGWKQTHQEKGITASLFEATMLGGCHQISEWELLKVVNNMNQLLVSSSNGSSSRGGLLKMVGHLRGLIDRDWLHLSSLYPE
jgi:hypothetical protein